MRVIILRNNPCIRSKPNISDKKFSKRLKRGSFEVWDERTVSIRQFDKKLGDIEGSWYSKGSNHAEIPCVKSDKSYCCWKKGKRGHTKHCIRKLQNRYFYYIDFESLEEFTEFVKEEAPSDICFETRRGVGLTVTLRSKDNEEWDF